MKKKIIFCSAVLNLAFAVSCAAQTVISEPKFLDDGYVVVSGTADVKNGLVALKAAKTGTVPEYVAIRETATDNDGKFNFSFRIPEQINGVSSNGTYRVCIKAKDRPMEEISFDYINFEYLLRKIREVKNGDELCAILKSLTDDDMAALKTMGMAADELEDKDIGSKLDEISSEWFKLCDLKNAEMSKVAEDFNRVLGVEYAKLGKTEKALELINPTYDGLNFKSAKNRSDIVKVMKNNMNAETLDKFNESYVLTNKIIEFRGLRASELTDAIQVYDEYFNFRASGKYSLYINMNLTKKGRVADNLSQRIGGDTVKATEIVSAFEDAVNAVEKTSSGSGDSSGGSGGGRGTGSYGSGETANEYKVEKPDVRTEKFTDLTDVEWAEEAIEKLAECGIVSGDENGKFNPNNGVTREEFIKMTVLACGIYDENSECSFFDTSIDKWHYRYIASAVKEGIINGIGDGSFGTGRRISREDMAVIIKRAASAAGKSFVQKRTQSEFADSDMIAEYAKDSVRELYCAEIINGVGENLFAPTENSTRAQAAKIIYEAFVKQ